MSLGLRSPLSGCRPLPGTPFGGNVGLGACELFPPLPSPPPPPPPPPVTSFESFLRNEPYLLVCPSELRMQFRKDF